MPDQVAKSKQSLRIASPLFPQCLVLMSVLSFATAANTGASSVRHVKAETPAGFHKVSGDGEGALWARQYGVKISWLGLMLSVGLALAVATCIGSALIRSSSGVRFRWLPISGTRKKLSGKVVSESSGSSSGKPWYLDIVIMRGIAVPTHSRS